MYVTITWSNVHEKFRKYLGFGLESESTEQQPL